MTVFVDDAEHPYGLMRMCHMMADEEAELHEMAGAIGVARKWFQGEASYPHYDICKSMRARAVALGAVEMTTKEMLTRLRHQRRKAPVQCRFCPPPRKSVKHPGWGLPLDTVWEDEVPVPMKRTYNSRANFEGRGYTIEEFPLHSSARVTNIWRDK